MFINFQLQSRVECFFILIIPDINRAHLILKPKEKYLQQSLTETVVVTKSVNIDSQKAENDKVDTERLTKKSLEEAKIIKKTCDYCGFLFASKANVRRHFEAVHLKLKPFSCHICGYKASDKTLLKIHLKHTHFKEKAACTICEKVYSNPCFNLNSKGSRGAAIPHFCTTVTATLIAAYTSSKNIFWPIRCSLYLRVACIQKMLF